MVRGSQRDLLGKIGESREKIFGLASEILGVAHKTGSVASGS